MIVDFLVVVLGCVLAPVSLAFFIWVSKKFVKFDKESLPAQKDYYWLKLAGSNKSLEEDNCSFSYRIVQSLYFILVIFIGFVFGYGFHVYNFQLLFKLCSISGCLTVVGLLVSTLVVISLALANKKDFYLGISSKDVVKQSCIPGGLANMYAGIIYMLAGYILHDVAVPDAYFVITELVQ